MRLLMLILSAVMTWTVETKNSVSCEGTYPASMIVEYSCSYQKGTVRAGDIATIAFSNMGGMKIEQIEVYVRSNKSSGAGRFLVVADGITVDSIEGTMRDLTGAYDNVDYHSLRLLHMPVPEVEELSVSLEGTVNSLYIEKYVIQYTPASAKSVTLMKGDAVYSVLTEKKSGAGVLLPSMPDEGNWRFLAWADSHFYENTTMPEVCHYPGRFYPAKDDTLWAVYSYEMSIHEVVATTLSDGLYLYADSTFMIAMKGAVVDGFTSNAAVNISDVSQIYEIDFDETCETATIYHPATDTYIGYQNKKLAAVETPWQVYHSGMTTAFYTRSDTTTYFLWPNYVKDIINNEYISCAALIMASDISAAPTILISVDEMLDEPVYTCHPERGLGMEDTPAPYSGGYEIPMGNYRMVIRNGQKTIHIQ